MAPASLSCLLWKLSQDELTVNRCINTQRRAWVNELSLRQALLRAWYLWLHPTHTMTLWSAGAEPVTRERSVRAERLSPLF